MKKKNILLVICFIAVFFVLQFIAGWCLKGNTYNSYGRIMMHDLHTTDKIDILFLGDSHLYNGVNVQELSNSLGKNVFTAATGSQEIDGNYALLREAYYFHPEIKTVYIDVDYFNNFQGDFIDRNHLRNIYVISDNLKNKRIKYDFLFHSCNPKYFLNHFLVFGKNKINGNPKDSIKTIKTILTGEYWKYTYPVDSEAAYKGNGYIERSSISTNQYFENLDIQNFDRKDVSKDWIKYFNKIITFCDENNIDLNFITIPETNYKVHSYVNYDDFILFMKDLLSDKKSDYYDLHLAKNLNLTKDNYYDYEHLNISGSTLLTDYLSEFLLLDKTQKNNSLYSSFSEKMNSIPKEIFGFTYEELKDSKGIKINPVTNMNDLSSLTYDYFYLDDNNTETVLKLNTSDITIHYPENTKGKIKVVNYINGSFTSQFEKDFNILWIK